VSEHERSDFTRNLILSSLTIVTAFFALTQVGRSQGVDAESAQVHLPTAATTQFAIHLELEATYLLAGVAKRKDLELPLRIYASKRLGEIRSGAGDMLWWIDQKEEIDSTIMPAIKAALHSAPWPDVKQKADELFPMPPSKDNRPLPSVAALAAREGKVDSGQKVFAGVRTCAKCHVVNQQGIEVGPDLSEIGSKLTKTSMYEPILFPSAGISHNYENWMVMTVDGEMITGVLLGESEQEIQLKDDKGIKHVIAMEDLEQKKQQ